MLGDARLKALQGALAGLGVAVAVVDSLHPGLERAVQLLQRGHFGGLDLGEKLAAYRAEEALDLTTGVRGVGGGMDRPDAQGGADRLQLERDIDLPVVHVETLGDAPAQKGELEHPFETGQALLEEELAVGDKAGGGVDEAEEGGGPVALPGVVGGFSLGALVCWAGGGGRGAGLAPPLEDLAQRACLEGQV